MYKIYGTFKEGKKERHYVAILAEDESAFFIGIRKGQLPFEMRSTFLIEQTADEQRAMKLADELINFNEDAFDVIKIDKPEKEIIKKGTRGAPQKYKDANDTLQAFKENIEKFKDEHGRLPLWSEYHGKSPSLPLLKRYNLTFKTALEAIGYNSSNLKYETVEDVLNAFKKTIKEFESKNSMLPTYIEYRNKKPSLSTIKKFGFTFSNALEAIGYEVTKEKTLDEKPKKIAEVEPPKKDAEMNPPKTDAKLPEMDMSVPYLRRRHPF